MIVAAVAAAGAGIWAVLRFRQKGTLLKAPRPFAFEAPTLLLRADFPEAEKPWLLAVFTANKCRSCAAVWDEAQKLVAAEPAASRVSLIEVESPRHQKLHRRYGIEAVPLTVAADKNGEVRACHLGLLAPAALTELASLFKSEAVSNSTG